MIWLYRFLWVVLSPVVDVWVIKRLFSGKEDRRRFKERLGVASIPRPPGRLIWFHGASVGETLSILPLVDRLLTADKNLHILVTSGTRTSAELMERKLPVGAFHQYVPLDFWPAVNSFLDYWRPDISVFVESEFWPELVLKAPNPILLNARITEKSFHKYKRMQSLFGPLMARFKTALAQTEQDALRLKELGVHTMQEFDVPTIIV